MPTDKKKFYILTVATLVVLLFAMLLPGSSGRIAAAILLLPMAIITWLTVKKRSVPSIHQRQILWIMALMGVIYLVLYYLSGLKFDFHSNANRTGTDSLWRFILPITAIIVAGEMFRYVIRAQNNRGADILSYIALVAADLCIGTGVGGIHSFNSFMDFLGLTLFPAVVANALYHYVAKRYGMYPNMVYRLLITLYAYVIPVVPAMPDPLFAFANMLVPLFIYVFLSMLYEKKKRYALERTSKLTVPATALAIAILLAFVMLISNQFTYGSLVIATDSMTGELNRGDSAIFEQYDDQTIAVGQVIVFEKDDSLIVHRVVDIHYINGVTQYYTKGDANEDRDTGHITEGDIVGIVHMKVPYVGYPTLWIRSLFSQ